MTVVMMFGGEARTGLTITQDGVKAFATPEDAADRLSATATALSRIAEAHTVVGEDRAPQGADLKSTLGRTVHGDVREAVSGIDEDATVIYVDREAAVLVTPDGSADTLPIRAHRDAGVTLATLARARDPSASK
jgi:hypothetical protein